MSNRRRGWLILAPFLFVLLALAAVQPSPAGPFRKTPEYLFCFWNVENLFDDHDDHHQNPVDRVFDQWFAEHPEIREKKYQNLSKALVALNDGRGPDILALAEVENVRAAELLRDALNAKLPRGAKHYEHVLMKNLAAGRHIAPAIITRLEVDSQRTRLHGSKLRILEGHVKAGGHDLTIMATHWTSRVVEEKGEHQGGHREKYAHEIYRVFRDSYAHDPGVDFLICGDFNDTPEDSSVKEGLRTVPINKANLRVKDNPVLINLFHDKNPADFGTHNYGGHWQIFDQIVVSPGLLDRRGWACEPESVKTIRTAGSIHLTYQIPPRRGGNEGDRSRERPNRFGNENDRFNRGFSDHLPVTVKLQVY